MALPSCVSSPAPRRTGPSVNGTCTEQMSTAEQLSTAEQPSGAAAFPPLSSMLALLVLAAALAGVMLVSVATFHFHKRRLRKRKIQRAQEEYERDSRRAAAATAAARPCVIARPARCAAHREDAEAVEEQQEHGGAPADC
ncbi:uncharacterized protein C11orf87 homolog [Syngnathus acus]|uniref:uncharacterized protein C11orf87 homolog n=1 Tax=Syngnathus acus TaxID=161584 RepID=UPI001886334F|nr:uncharacterized protein C11orf87 homolog [Syngnathus acus]